MSQIELPVFEPAPPTPLPNSLLVRYGSLRLLADLPYDGAEKPVCGRKAVIRSSRGTELAEILTTTCPNTGCAKGVSREKASAYFASSGGKDYPFTTEGRVIRLATREDVIEQARLNAHKGEYLSAAKRLVEEMQLPMKIVDVELILGGEMAIFYFASEHRVDFRGLVKQLAAQFHTRILMHQVGARDEARLVADFETCGQQCCCKQFLKLLKPVSMGSAKMQKATLDPSKISGRCGRLKCCLRYEEQTYEQLRKNLPRNGTRVRVSDGVGTIVEGMILTQLVKVSLDSGRWTVVPLDEILERDLPPAPEGERETSFRDDRPPRRDRIERRDKAPAADTRRPPVQAPPQAPVQDDEEDAGESAAPETADQAAADSAGNGDAPPSGNQPPQAGPRPGRRRRRRRGGRGGDRGNPGGNAPPLAPPA